VGQRFLGPSFRDEAVVAGASDPLLLGWTVDRGGDETRVDVEGHVDNGEAVGRRAELDKVAPLGGRIGEKKSAVGVELGTEAEDGKLPMSRSARSIAAQASSPTLSFAGSARSAD
jgi:hypothetical protein